MNISEMMELKEQDIESMFSKKVYDFPTHDEAREFYACVCLQNVYTNIELNDNQVIIYG